MLIKLLWFVVLFYGNTAIHFACENDDIKVLEYLLDLKQDPKAKNNNCKTPHHKASENSEEKVKILLKSKVEINAKNGDDCFFVYLFIYLCDTPLHIACRNKNLDIVKFLISKGADINSINYRGILLK